jgi:signal transduction histidine kinase
MLTLSPRTNFEAIAERVRQLVCCNAALFVLDCPVPDRSHPLLSLQQELLPASHRWYGTHGLTEVEALLQAEPLRALRDIACRSGRIRYLNQQASGEGEHARRHIAVVPVECSEGLPGYIVLIDTSMSGFSAGEISLLQQHLPLIQTATEQALRAFVLDSLAHARKASYDGVRRDEWQRDVARVLSGVSMVGHELRAPLTAIIGYAGLLQAYDVSEPERVDSVDRETVAGAQETEMTSARRQRYLNMILEEAQRLEVLVADLLDVSRLQSGKLALRYEQIDVRDLCERAVRQARMRIEQQATPPVTLHCSLPASLSSLHTFQADPHRLLQVLNNLLENAIKYSLGGGHVELIVQTAGNDQRSVTFTVRDEGIGIPATQKAHLFQPFSRVENARTRQVQGAGLGLYITSLLVQAMHGSIELTSSEGNGTTVSVSLPLQSPEKFVELSKSAIFTAESATPVHVLSV